MQNHADQSAHSIHIVLGDEWETSLKSCGQRIQSIMGDKCEVMRTKSIQSVLGDKWETSLNSVLEVRARFLRVRVKGSLGLKVLWLGRVMV